VAASAAPTPVPSAPTPATASPAPAAVAAAGLLVLDALPWGEVVEVLDEQGRRQPVASNAYTPLVVSLPPGKYRVSIRNPDFPKAVTLSATVGASRTERRVAEFRKVDAAEYFRRAGW
jgi:hypothetical protein